LVLGLDQDLISVTFTRTGFNTEEYTGSYAVWRGTNENGNLTITTKDDISAFYLSFEGQDYTGVEAVDSKGYFFKVPDNNYETCGVSEEIVENPPLSSCDGDECMAVLKVLLLHNFVVDINTIQYDLDGNILYSNPFSARLALAREMQVLSVLSVNQDVLDNSKVKLYLEYDFQYAIVPDEGVGSQAWLPQYDDLRSYYTTLKNLAGADIVQVIIDDTSWGLAGVADGPLTIYDLSQRYMTFAHLWASSSTRYSSIHEIAHLFGASHNDGNSSGEICSGAWEFSTGLLSRTVMAFADDGERVPYFSDPDILYGVVPLGSQANRNADVMRDVLCALGNPSTPAISWDFNIVTGIPTCIDFDGTNGNSIFEVIVTEPIPNWASPGRGPYLYRWGEITNGQNVLITTTPNSIIDLRDYLSALPIPGQQREVQVTAVASDGATLTESFSFYDVDCGFFNDDMQLKIVNPNTYFNLLGQEVYPKNGSFEGLPKGIYVKCPVSGGCTQFLIQ